VDGKGAGPAPAEPQENIPQEEMPEAIQMLKAKIVWLEGREEHLIYKIQCQKDEISKLEIEAVEAKRSLQTYAIKATLKTIQGISTSTKRLQTNPHDMHAAELRVNKYKIPWGKMTVPPREINPQEVPIEIINWETVEKVRTEKYPDDKQVIPVSWYTKNYELKAGSAKSNTTYDDKEEPRRGRGDHNPQYRGYRGGRGRGYRGNQ
jgi:hypothetical protein